MKIQNSLRRLLALLLAAVLAIGCGSPSNVTGTAQTSDGQPAQELSGSPVESEEQPAQGLPAYPTEAEDARSFAPAYPQPATTPEIPLVPGSSSGAVSGVAQRLPDALRRTGAPVIEMRVVASYPHDPQAFTQGLVYVDDDRFYESTGLYGSSTLREVALDGTLLREPHILESHYFAEGIAVVDDLIFQLTWREGVGFVYQREDFSEYARFSYPPAERELPVEGWGLTFDGQHLIMSDGTATLYTIDPEATLRTGELVVLSQVEVFDRLGPVPELNELEYIHGEVYANIWFSDLIARIDPVSGQVLAYLDLSILRDDPLLTNPPGMAPPEVLNGIAYDATNDRLFVTGKLWPRLFEVEQQTSGWWRVYLPMASMF